MATFKVSFMLTDDAGNIVASESNVNMYVHGGYPDSPINMADGNADGVYEASVSDADFTTAGYYDIYHGSTKEVDNFFIGHNLLVSKWTDLASTANAKGASMIGIEDAGANYAAVQVEAALAEVHDDLETHEANASAHHTEVTALAASAITVVDAGSYFVGADVETILQELGKISMDATAPSVPTGLSLVQGYNVVNGVGRPFVRASWNQSTDEAGGSGMHHYIVSYRGAASGPWVRNVAEDGSANYTVYLYDNIDFATTYWVKVKAVDAAGNASSFTAESNVTTDNEATPTTAWNEVRTARGNLANLNARMVLVMDSDGKLQGDGTINTSAGDIKDLWDKVDNAIDASNKVKTAQFDDRISQDKLDTNVLSKPDLGAGMGYITGTLTLANTEYSFAHGLGKAPSYVSVVNTVNFGVIRESQAATDTYIYLKGELAATTFKAYCM